MGRPRVMPTDDQLQRMVDDGMNVPDITDALNNQRRAQAEAAGEDFQPISRSTVASAMRRAGIKNGRTRNRYDVEIPWTVPTRHSMAYPAMMLRLMGRRRVGAPMTTHEAELLDAWLAERRLTQTVVAFNANYGFRYVRAHDGDAPNGVPIRPTWLTDDQFHDEAVVEGITDPH